MEACVTVEKECDKVLKKLASFSDLATGKLQTVVDEMTALKEEISAAPPGATISPVQAQSLRDLAKTVKEVAQGTSADHKDVHVVISKFGRAIDKNFQANINDLCVEGLLTTDKNSRKLQKVLCEHLLREGKQEVSFCLMEEAGVSVDSDYMAQFSEMNRILEALRNRNLEPAIEWVEVHREELSSSGSTLEFKLHQLKLVSLLCSGRMSEAMAYARTMGRFTPTHTTEVKRLMGCFLFCRRGLECSPYSDLLDPGHWTDVADTFAKDACNLLGLSLESPLGVSLSTGCIALPQLLHLRSVMLQRQVSDIWNQDELACEVNLGWDRRYHSVFTCPILRQQTTDSNPPVRLRCGHSISKDAMKKLVTHSRRSLRRLKCPYCPVEMTESEVKNIKF